MTINYSYDGRRIVREVRGPTTLKYVHGPGIDEPLAVDDGMALSYLHADGLGSVTKTTDAAGAVTLTRRYDAWGNLELGVSEPGFAFTGREWDPETGFYYLRARYYSANAGRFISSDPAGMSDSLNGYSYVHNQPTVRRDPSGKYTMAPSAKPFGGLIDDAMGLLITILEQQPKHCCLDWFNKHGGSPPLWATPGVPPEVRVQDLTGGHYGYTQAPYDFVVLDPDILSPAWTRAALSPALSCTSSATSRENDPGGEARSTATL